VNLPSSVARLVPSLDGPSNLIRDSWDRLQSLPGGRAIFSRLVGRGAPYTGSIGAHVEELDLGHARVTMRDRRKVRNHIRCVHAIALANLAEMCGNVALAYSLPDDARFIVAGFTIEYIKKARGTITAVASCPVPPTNERKEFDVEVIMYDESEEVVCKVTLRSLVGPKPSRHDQ